MDNLKITWFYLFFWDLIFKSTCISQANTRLTAESSKLERNVLGCGGNYSGIKILLQKIYKMDLVRADG